MCREQGIHILDQYRQLFSIAFFLNSGAQLAPTLGFVG
jgi:hypothetical protein